MNIPLHLGLTGEKQGKIKGSCEIEGREESIIVYAMHHRVSLPYSAVDSKPTGKRKHGSFSIIKEIDRSSPQLFQALTTGEQFSNVSIKFYRINPLGSEEHYFSCILKDASIVSINSKSPISFLPQNDSFKAMEIVSFSYNNIRWVYETDGIESEDRNCTSLTFAEEVTAFLDSMGQDVCRIMSSLGSEVSHYLNNRGKKVISAMNDDYYQSLFGLLLFLRHHCLLMIRTRMALEV